MADGWWVGERPEVVLLRLQEELRQRLHAHEADDEDASKHKPQQGKNVEDTAQPLPALALWVVEDLFVHRRCRVLIACGYVPSYAAQMP